MLNKKIHLCYKEPTLRDWGGREGMPSLTTMLCLHSPPSNICTHAPKQHAGPQLHPAQGSSVTPRHHLLLPGHLWGRKCHQLPTADPERLSSLGPFVPVSHSTDQRRKCQPMFCMACRWWPNITALWLSGKDPSGARRILAIPALPGNNEN